MEDLIYKIRNLKVAFYSSNSFVKAVEGIDIDIPKAKRIAIVGESGCGKSVTCYSILNLLGVGSFTKADKMEFYDDDKVIDIINSPKNVLEDIRGNKISMIFQDPNSSLNPVLTIGEQIDEVLISHLKLNRNDAKNKTIDLLKMVGIPDSEKRYSSYPHEMSGGQKQRVIIAMAMACNPKLLLADEPTTALDVTVQKQILDLIDSLVKENNMSLLLITHDLGVVRNYSDYIYVMYCGKIVEEGNTKDVLENPLHPYTRALIDTIPHLGEKKERFLSIPNFVPSPLNKPSGCYFSNRCEYCTKLCESKMPPLSINDHRKTRCWRNIK